MQKTPADVLEEAADLLLIHGRCRHALVDGAGRMCALGAMVKVVYGDPKALLSLYPQPAYIEAFSRLSRHVGRGVDTWNNDPATTDDEVRDTLLLVAKDLRNEAS